MDPYSIDGLLSTCCRLVSGNVCTVTINHEEKNDDDDDYDVMIDRCCLASAIVVEGGADEKLPDLTAKSTS
jgi:hypothetical protein